MAYNVYRLKSNKLSHNFLVKKNSWLLPSDCYVNHVRGVGG